MIIAYGLSLERLDGTIEMEKTTSLLNSLHIKLIRSVFKDNASTDLLISLQVLRSRAFSYNYK